MVAMSDKVLARVKFPFNPRYEDELQVQFNDIIQVIELECGVEGWSEVEHRGVRGKIPTEYFQVLTEEYFGAYGKSEHVFEHPDTPDSGQFLKFEAGEQILVVDRPPSGWCVGIHNEHLGLFPDSFVTFPSHTQYSDVEEMLIHFSTPNSPEELTRDLPEARSFCNAVEVSSAEAVAKDLILIFEKHHKVQELIETVIHKEVEQTPNEGTLFRKNGLSSHIMTQYARLIAKEYFRRTLAPLIGNIVNAKNSFEIDPHKTDPHTAEANINGLQRACQMFLHKIMESISGSPIALRRMCWILQQAVMKKFPEARRKVVGGFYFLRLICPAVVSPDGFGVVESIDDTSRRALILISKILQTLSNGVMFGVKEPYMTPMNTFITDNLENCHFILDKLVSFPPDAPVERLPALETDKYVALMNRMHVQLARSKTKYFKLLKDNYNYSNEQCRRMADIIIRLGPTPKLENPGQNALKSSAPVRSGTPTGRGLQRTPSQNALNDKRAKQRKEKDEEKRLKEERKMKEKEKKQREKDNKKKEDPSVPAPQGAILVESFLSKKQNGVIQWKKRYFVLYSISTKIYIFNTEEDAKHNNFCGIVELAPSYKVNCTGKTKLGWEFTISTLREEHFFFTQSENDMRQWVSCLDRRLREILMPENDRAMKQQLIESMEAKMEMYLEDRKATKVRLAAVMNDPEKSAIEANHLEELIVCIETLSRTLAMAKAQ